MQIYFKQNAQSLDPSSNADTDLLVLLADAWGPSTSPPHLVGLSFTETSLLYVFL